MTESSAVIEKIATETGLSMEELGIAETLVKAKNDTPKDTQKAKGVETKEGGQEQKRKEVSETELKSKGKEKMDEYVKPQKKQKQMELEEEIAKKLQAELRQEEDLRDAAEAKKVQAKASMPRQPAQTKKRQPSKTFVANQERRKMINFLKGSVGVKEGMFTGMSYGSIEELYKKEMAKLQGDFTQRVEVERKMKERHDLHIQQPFPENEETTPTKEVEEEQKE
ncbi:hypothetical protein L6452_09084 [Arctium lappa]|uniref:Uncharacterized protein n=1 Tax=Arctium lappa TaxID=4217 RepID=A0ACB9DJI2_ARCLA|nr:hypothetical protein L6452_09084 [Arctium lappa]